MAWRSPFLAALASNARGLKLVVESLQVHQEPGTPFRIASHLGLGADLVCIGNASDGGAMVNVQGATLSPRGWKTTIGAFSVGLVGGISEIHKRWTRGTVLVLYAGFDGMNVADFEPIGIGQYQNVRGTAPMWTLECWTLDNALRQRLDTSAAATRLFSGLPITSELDASYSVGDTVITVLSTVGFERETGAAGLVQIDDFYLTYTGTTATTLTGVSVVGQVGSTASSASSGTTITSLAYLAGHPMDIARKILCSRDGTNGSYDVLPEKWGVALADNLIDHDDIDRYVADVAVVASGSYVWELVFGEPQDDALATISGFLNSAGFFLTTRQGLLTVRAAQDTLTASYHSGIEITDADIAEIESYEAYDFAHSPEHDFVQVRATLSSDPLTTSAALEPPATLPSAQAAEYELTPCLFSNAEAVAEEMISRLEESARRVPELLVVRCAGLRLAQLAPGDVTDFTCTRTHSRRDGPLGWKGRRAGIVAVSPDWHGGTVRVGLVVYPTTGDEFA